MGIYRRVGFVITHRCNARCDHCFVESGPERNEKMHIDDALLWMNELEKFKEINGIFISGGEPFLYIEDLIQLVENATKLNKISHVVTNGFWAKDIVGAQEIIAPLAQAGLDRMSVSCDQYHLNWMPFDNVDNAVKVATKFGIQVRIAATYLKKHENEWLKKRFKGKIGVFEQELTPFGRARVKIPLSNFSKHGINKFLDGSYCEAITTPVIEVNGAVHACPCGSLAVKDTNNPLILGNAYKTPLPEILARAGSNYLFVTLATYDAFKVLIKIIRENGLGHKLNRRYYSLCDLCCQLMSDEEMYKVLCDAMNQPKEKIKAYLRYAVSGRKDAFEFFPLDV